MTREQREIRSAFFGAAPSSTHPIRAVGSTHLLVILAEFAGKPHRIDASRFNDLLFGPSSSVKSFYSEASEGAFNLTGTIHGWVPLPGTQLDYSANQGGVGTYPENGQKMAEDAIQSAISAGLQLGDYDADGDEIVDAVLVIHSGQGLEWCGNPGNTPQPDASAINSHKWVVRQQSFAGQSARVVQYFTCPELQLLRVTISPGWSDSISTVGVYCHEFGHMLGLPDFYDTVSGAVRVGVWDLMDTGSWNPGANFTLAPGSRPSKFSAWSKMFLQWAEPEVIAPGAGEVESTEHTLFSTTLGNAPLQLLENPGGIDWSSTSPGRGEFFLAELRTRDGFDGGLPDSGVLLYHVDESRESNRNSDNPDGGRLLALIPQDGVVDVSVSGSRGDPWPGLQNTFSETSQPSSDRYNGSPSGVSLSAITLHPGSSLSATMNVTITNLDPTPVLPFARPNPWNALRDPLTEIVLRPREQQVPLGTRILLHDLAGRILNILGEKDLVDGRRIAQWNGLDQSGATVPPGVYFYRVEEPGLSARTGRIILLR